jgi:hypothetical protein
MSCMVFAISGTLKPISLRKDGHNFTLYGNIEGAITNLKVQDWRKLNCIYSYSRGWKMLTEIEELVN